MPKDPQFHGRSSRTSPNLASCMLATVFFLLVLTGAVTVYFVFFKPKEPKIAVEIVQFPTFSVSNGTVNFTFLQHVSVTNPNREDFTHYDTSLPLVYSENPVGISNQLENLQLVSGLSIIYIVGGRSIDFVQERFRSLAPATWRRKRFPVWKSSNPT